MKTLLSLFLAFSLFSSGGEEDFGKDSFMDLLEQSEKVPVVFLTQEVIYNPYVPMVVGYTMNANQKVPTYEMFNTCGFVEPIPVTSGFDGMDQLFVDQLNEFFGTDKFYIYTEELSKVKKKGLSALADKAIGAEVTNKVTPDFNGYNLEPVQNPIMVFASLTALYESDAVLANDQLKGTEKAYKEKARVAGVDEFKSSLNPVMSLKGSFVAEFKTYDSKKKRAKMIRWAQPVMAEVTHDETFTIDACRSAVTEFTIMQHPDQVVEPLKIEMKNQIESVSTLLKKKG